MSTINDYQQNQAMDIAKGASMLAIGAVVGVLIVSARVNRMEKRIGELQRAAELNGAVTLGLTDRVARISRISLDNQ